MSNRNVNITVTVHPELPMILFVLFLVLKLCGVIAWSWWWVFAPLWIPVVLVFWFFLLFGLSLV